MQRHTHLSTVDYRGRCCTTHVQPRCQPIVSDTFHQSHAGQGRSLHGHSTRRFRRRVSVRTWPISTQTASDRTLTKNINRSGADPYIVTLTARNVLLTTTLLYIQRAQVARCDDGQNATNLHTKDDWACHRASVYTQDLPAKIHSRRNDHDSKSYGGSRGRHQGCRDTACPLRRQDIGASVTAINRCHTCQCSAQ